MEIPFVASRYARTLYDFAVEEGARDAVRSDCEAIRRLIATSPEFAAFVANPTIPPEAASSAINELFGNKAHEATLRFLGFLCTRGRLNLLEAVCDLFEERVCEEQGLLKVRITSAHELSDAQLATMKQKLADRYAKTIEAEANVDPALLGGFKVQVGDRIKDLSMSNKLDQFEQRVINAKHEHDKLKG
jgi:F-type H+-transporting ATPase subunit delta